MFQRMLAMLGTSSQQVKDAWRVLWGIKDDREALEEGELILQNLPSEDRQKMRAYIRVASDKARQASPRKNQALAFFTASSATLAVFMIALPSALQAKLEHAQLQNDIEISRARGETMSCLREKNELREAQEKSCEMEFEKREKIYLDGIRACGKEVAGLEKRLLLVESELAHCEE